jgi:hypothetical protein
MQEPILNKKLIEGTSAIGTIVPVPDQGLKSVRELIIYILFGAGTSAGTYQVEEAPFADYGGTWVAVGSPVAWATVSTAHKVAVTGAHGSVRVRCTVAVVGGTVDIYAFGN